MYTGSLLALGTKDAKVYLEYVFETSRRQDLASQIDQNQGTTPIFKPQPLYNVNLEDTSKPRIAFLEKILRA